MKLKTLNENVKELPKWAQEEIRVLQMRLMESKAELVMINDNPESNTVIGNNYTFKDEPVKYLANNQMITFVLNDECYITALIKDDYLDITGQGNLKLFVRPVVSNSIQLHFK